MVQLQPWGARTNLLLDKNLFFNIIFNDDPAWVAVKIYSWLYVSEDENLS
jgi:hypothetical protein